VLDILVHVFYTCHSCHWKGHMFVFYLFCFFVCFFITCKPSRPDGFILLLSPIHTLSADVASLKIANVQAHNVAHKWKLWACTSAVYTRVSPPCDGVWIGLLLSTFQNLFWHSILFSQRRTLSGFKYVYEFQSCLSLSFSLQPWRNACLMKDKKTCDQVLIIPKQKHFVLFKLIFLSVFFLTTSRSCH